MNVLCLGAHPDDVEVGMGGTVKRYASEGHKVWIVSMCVPDGLECRREESERAAEILGAEHIYLDLPPEDMRADIAFITRLDLLFRNSRPWNVIYTHWIHDSHQDHRTVAEATISMTRFKPCAVYMYEVIPSGITPYTFRAQRFVDISPYLAFKLNSVSEHASQTKRYGADVWLDGITGLATYRGFQMGALYAEAFEVVKDIVPISSS